MSEHIVAAFSTEADAEAAAQDLRTIGFPESAIRRYRSEAAPAGSAAEPSATAAQGSSGGGFWAWLLGEEPAAGATRRDYAEEEEWYDGRVRAGNPVLGVVVHDDSLIHRAVEALDAHHPVAMEEKTDESIAPDRTATSVAAQETASRQAGEVTPTRQPATARSMQAGSTEEVIPLAEEQVEIGKRKVDRGTTRVRRYVVETPVEREVTLRGERVTVEHRRPTETSVAGQGFEERTVEVHETEEEPVVEKSARVVDEVVVRKEPTERTETVRETVRRDKVEVPNREEQPSRLGKEKP